MWRRRAIRWLRERARFPLSLCAIALAVSRGRGPAPGDDLDALGESLGRSAGGAAVSVSDVRWGPSDGLLADLAFGRPVLFLAKDAGDETRDVWRARVRVSPEGRAIEVLAGHDLTNTPLGDDHQLVVRRDHAAFATRAYGREQSLTVLDLAGEGAQNRTETLEDRTMAALTNLQQTGTLAGVGRVDISLEAPATAVALALDDADLDIVLCGEDPRQPTSRRAARFDLARGDWRAAAPGLRADATMHLPKRFSHWLVDTLRAVSSIGPAPIAWFEDQALAARDAYRRFTFESRGDAADVVASAQPPPPTLDTSEASVEEAHWPPPSIPTIWRSAEKGEGIWAPPDVPWLRTVPGVAPDAPASMQVTFVRPDEERPYARVLLVAMDMRQLDLDMEAGVEDPEPLVGPHGSGRIPRDPSIYRRVTAAFNGAFKTEHGHYGMMVHKRVLLPPVPGAATVAVLADGRVGFGTWGADRRVGGIEGVDDGEIASFRQNLDPLIDRGQVNPTGRNLWGFTLPGKGAQTERSGLCVTTAGHILYAWGDDISGTALAKAMKMGGCDYGLHLDMNPYHTGFLFAAIDDLPARKYKSQLLTPAMSIPTDRYVQYAPKDFFYLMVHDPAPPAVQGATGWKRDDGAQPPPAWMPGIWRTSVDTPAGPVELLDVEAGRATWRVRAGARESPAASPLRSLVGDEAKRVLFALGAGVALDKHPRGLATAGRLAVSVHGGADSGVLAVSADGALSVARSTEASPVDARGDLLELPIVLWDGRVQVASPAAAVEPRSAIGLAASGRVVVARGSFASAEPLAEALVRAGCVRALALDRGAASSAFLDRAGTASAPRASYEESVVYAVAAPMRPRTFHFEASTRVAQGATSK